MNAIEFREAMRSAGLIPPESIEPGKLHRFSSNGKRGDDAGWCKLFPDLAGGVFGDHRTGIYEVWQAEREKPYTSAEREAFRQRCEQERQEREAEETRRHAEAASKAATIWKAASPAGEDHPYLVRKHVKPVSTLRELPADKLASLLGYAPKSKGEPLAGRVLIVPIKVGNKLSTVELIDEVGRKSAIAGGVKAGGYWAAQQLPDTLETILIGEGVATVLSPKESTGHPVIAALSSGNLPKVARAMRASYPAARLVILADLVKANGEPDSHAIEAAQSVGGLLAIPDFGDNRDPGMKDMNDLAVLHGREAIQRAIANARPPDICEQGQAQENAPQGESESLLASVSRLAGLHPLEYEQVREAEAHRLGVRVGVLDKEVSIARRSKQEEGGKAAMFPTVEPCPEHVNVAGLLDELVATVHRFIICDRHTAITAALWIVFTWLIDRVQVAPLAVITAPEKRCGKSQLLTLIGRLSRRPAWASNISPPTVFRMIEAHCPTLLIDEADSFFKDNEELRGVINSGHTRQLAYVWRTVGDDHEPRQFSTWGAKAISGIGHLSETLMDRAVILELRRKLPKEKVDRLRHAEPGLFDRLASMLARFAEDAGPAIERARPDLPEALNDRAQDNWEPLLAIADHAGGDWPRNARDAALKLSGVEQEALSLTAELLADIREVFEHKRVDRITTADLLQALTDDDLKPWATYYRGKPMTPRQLAKRLDEYHVNSRDIRFSYEVRKGYDLAQFTDAFNRYLSPHSPPATSATPQHPSNHGPFDVADDPQRCGNEALSATSNPPPDKACSVVADKTEGGGGVWMEAEI